MSAASTKKAKAAPPDLLALSFEIIADSGWAGFSFDQLADRAETTLAEIRKSFQSRAALLDELSLRLDEAMLTVDSEDLADLPMRDRVFELIMSRLEAMASFRSGLLRMVQDARRDPELVLMSACRLDRSMTWLQEAAGFGSNGLRQKLQRHLLTAVYLKTLKAWSDDDSSDLAKTMASLDKDLRRIETLANLQSGRQ